MSTDLTLGKGEVFFDMTSEDAIDGIKSGPARQNGVEQASLAKLT